MADLKIKLKFGEFEFEIEGDKDSVIQEFKSLRENGISKIIESIEPTISKKNDSVGDISETKSGPEQKQMQQTNSKVPIKKNSGKKNSSEVA